MLDPMTDADALKAQVEAQQRQIAELEAKTAVADGGGKGTTERRPRHPHRMRGLFAALLIVLGTILTPITLVALFVHTEVTDTGRYVQNVAPLATNPAIQAYVATDISNRLFAEVDIASYVKDALPARAQPLAGPLTSALKGFVHETTLRVLQSKQFAQLWKDVNRVAHSQMVNVLTGREGGAVTA